jgi:predicted RNA-binding Zn-ribbon protein involved in translation (DUF1610 family)
MAITRVSDVFVEANIQAPKLPIITDNAFKTSCPTCGEEQFLNQCKVYERDLETRYKCKNECQIIVKVVPFSDSSGIGYRLNNFVIKNESDLYFIQPNAATVLIPKP